MNRQVGKVPISEGASATSHRQGEAAIGRRRSAGDVASLVRAKEDFGSCNLLRTTRTPRVNALLENLVIPVVANKPSRPAMHRRIDETRAYEVDPDSLRGQLCENTRSQSDQSAFRSDVRGAGGKVEEKFTDPTLTIAPPRPPASMALASYFMQRKVPIIRKG